MHVVLRCTTLQVHHGLDTETQDHEWHAGVRKTKSGSQQIFAKARCESDCACARAKNARKCVMLAPTGHGDRSAGVTAQGTFIAHKSLTWTLQWFPGALELEDGSHKVLDDRES